MVNSCPIYIHYSKLTETPTLQLRRDGTPSPKPNPNANNLNLNLNDTRTDHYNSLRYLHMECALDLSV
jgi:hypothetical protein